MARFAQIDTELELERRGVALIERRLGSPKAETRDEHPDEAAAVRAYYRRVAELVETKWRRVSPCEDHAPVPNPALAAAVATGDPDAYAVYTDWLIDRGDPCGELASLRAAGDSPETAAAIADLEQRCAIELYGLFGAVDPAWRAQLDMTWRHGWIHEIVARHRYFQDGRVFFAANAPDALHHALHMPMAQFVGGLVLDGIFWRAARTVLRECRLSHTIRSLRLTERAHWTDELVDVFPDLEHLELVRGAKGKGHPGVRSLKITSRRGFDHQGDWPAVRRLHLAIDEPAAFREMRWRDLFPMPRLPAVTDVTISCDEPCPRYILSGVLREESLPALASIELAGPVDERALETLLVSAGMRGIRVVQR